MSNDQKVILAFLAGAATGAIAGILLAPNSGEETRKKIADKASELKDDLNSQISVLSNKISNLGATMGVKKNSTNAEYDLASRKPVADSVDV